MSEGESAVGALLDSPAPEAPEVAPDTAPPVDVESGVPVEPGLEPAQPAELPEEESKPSKNFATEATRLLRELSDTNPDKAALLRQIRSAVFRDVSYKGHFDTPESAGRIKATFDAIGGENGVAELQEAAAAMRRVDDEVQAGSPEFIDAWVKESPEGFAKAAPYALQKLEEINPAAYERMMAPRVIKMFWNTNINDVVKNLEGYALKFGDPNFTSVISGMRNWLNEMVQSYRTYEQQQNDPRSGQYQQEQAQLAKQREDLFEQRLRMATQADLERSIEDAFKQHDRNNIFKGDARTAMLQEIAEKIRQTLGADKGYQTMIATLKAKGDLDGLSRYVKSKVDSVRGVAAREVWQHRAAPFQRRPPQSASAQAPAATNGNAPAPRAAGSNKIPLPIPQKPDRNDLDWSKDPNRYEFMNGRGYLKSNGRYVTWRKVS